VTLNLAPVLDELTESCRERGSEASVSTMTVVVFFENPEIGSLARDRIHMLADKHPSRVVMLDGSEGESLHRVDGCDWIELGVKGSEPEFLRSAVSALRLPEAPVVLLWIAAGISNDGRFATLSGDVQTVVYNSSLVDVGHNALCELVDYVEHHPRLPLADIAYLRLSPWQECVAVFFDGKNVTELRELERVEIACGSEPEAYYLLGWLASRLQWRPCAADALLDPLGKRVTFEMKREGEPRRIARVALSSAHSTFCAEVEAGAETIRLSVTGSSAHARRYRAVKNPGIAALVERAILWGENDRVFQAALAAAGEILAQVKE
jgi:glucose-6-phosphate dehydrogenase assembly protein OpcA